MPPRPPIPLFFRVLILAAILCFCVVSVRWLDRPVASHVEGLRHSPYGGTFSLLRHALTLGLTALAALPLLGIFGIVRARIQTARGITPGRAEFVLALAGISVIASLAVNELLLKPLFGRHTLEDYFAQPSLYGFVFLHGSPESSFPSGHAVMAVSFLSVLLAFYPRRRAALLGMIGAVLIALILTGWHFLSDVAAGVVIGTIGGLTAVRLGTRLRPGCRSSSDLRRMAFRPDR
jgi:membrane-associated phospholipid phosphatase